MFNCRTGYILLSAHYHPCQCLALFPALPSMQTSTGPIPSAAASATVHRRPPEEETTDYWSFDLFGCLSDWRLCCATFIVPCYTVGRNAAYFYDDGAFIGALYCLGMCALGPVIRWRIRQHRRLHGTMLTDVAVHLLCPCCALIQENRELYGFEGSHIGERVPINIEITRK